MAYETNDALPQEVKETLPEPAQNLYRAAFNGASSDGMNDEGAHQVAWNSVKNTFEQTQDGSWQYKAENWEQYTNTGTMPQS